MAFPSELQSMSLMQAGYLKKTRMRARLGGVGIHGADAVFYLEFGTNFAITGI